MSAAWKMVPVEPTGDMLSAAVKCTSNLQAYRAMVKACHGAEVRIRTGRVPGIMENEHGTGRSEQGTSVADGSSGLDENAGRGSGSSREVSGFPEQVTTWGQGLAAAPDRYAPVRTEPDGNFKLLQVAPEVSADVERAYRLGFLRANNPGGWDEQDDITHGDARFYEQMITDLESKYPSEASS